MDDCQHFNGFQNESCRAGVKYDFLATGLGCILRRPCLQRCDVNRAKFPLVDCPSFLPLCDEEVAAQEKDDEERWERVARALKSVKEDAKERGLGKEPKRHGGTGKIFCPICFTGTISYSVKGYNGHSMGSCSTKDCVRWME